jgi:hypothetical protein
MHRFAGSRLWRTAAAALLCCAVAAAQAVERDDLKAAIVYNILLFVDWPSDAAPVAGGSLVLCTDPASTLNTPLKSLAGRPVHAYRLELHELAAGESPRRCHALFLDAGSRVQALPLRRQLKGLPVLVIGDEPSGADEPVAIHLDEANGRMAFDVDMATVKQARLQLSSRLLRLARRVNE